MKNILWQPTEFEKTHTNMWSFLKYVNQQCTENVVDYEGLYQWSITHPDQFWKSIVSFHDIHFSQAESQVFNQNKHMLDSKWFEGAKLNFAENLLGKIKQGDPNKIAIRFHGESITTRQLSNAELLNQVKRLVHTLKKLRIKPGDRIVGYMPNMPETIVAMLATTSLGAIWSSCSPDFGYNGIMDRFGQIQPKILFTADVYYFKHKKIDCLKTVTDLQSNLPSLVQTIVVPYDDKNVSIPKNNNWISYPDLLNDAEADDIQFSQQSFDHPLYIMFSSGTTGVPKCIIHGAGGTLLQHVKELSLHCDLSDQDILFYYTTCGWMMWNWMVSALTIGCSLVLYDGSPFYPSESRLMEIVEQDAVTVFGTSAKYIAALQKSNQDNLFNRSILNLRLILSTGSPLAPESFDYLYDSIKHKFQLCSISGGTDIISCFALGNPLVPVYRGELQCRGLGMDVAIFDDSGNSIKQQKGELVCLSAFPSMPIGFWNDESKIKYKNSYFSKYKNIWSQGDYATLTENNGLIIYGRSDAILNPGGVRIGTAEIYRQVERFDEVVESIAIGQQWENDVRVILFVKLRDNDVLSDTLKTAICHSLKTNATPRHVPAKIIQVDDIPRTISGKIVELAVKNVVHGEVVKNTDALANPQALENFKNLPELET